MLPGSARVRQKRMFFCRGRRQWILNRLYNLCMRYTGFSVYLKQFHIKMWYGRITLKSSIIRITYGKSVSCGRSDHHVRYGMLIAPEHPYSITYCINCMSIQYNNIQCNLCEPDCQHNGMYACIKRFIRQKSQFEMAEITSCQPDYNNNNNNNNTAFISAPYI